MKARRSLAACLGLAVLVAATVALGVPRAQLRSAPGVSRSQLRGRPEIRIGAELSYFAWMDGNDLHVRWTTTNPDNHAFRGEVNVEGGELANLQRVSLEDSDRTALESPRKLTWNAVEQRGLDGFDITLPGPATVRFSIDGQPASKAMILLGGRRKPNGTDGELVIGAR